MKKSLLVLVAVLISVVAIAQAPQKMTYQAVVRDNNGRLVSNGNVGVRITIVRGSETGSAVYGQSETVRTNDNGLFTIMIGGNSFESIDWSNGPYYLKSEVDPDGGTNYILTTTQQMVSVPYALHAGTVDNIIGGVNFTETDPVFTAWDKDYNDLINKPNFSDSVSRIVYEYHLGDTIISYITQNGYVDSSYVINYNTQQGYVDTAYVTNYINNSGVLTTESDPVFTAWDKDYNDLINKPNFSDSVSRIVYEYHLGDTIINYVSQNGYVDSSYVINYNTQQGYVDTTYVTNYISNGGAVTSESDPVFAAWDKDYNDLINRPSLADSVSQIVNEYHLGDTIINYISQNGYVDSSYVINYNTQQGYVDTSYVTNYISNGGAVTSESDPVFTAWDKDYNDLINRPTIPILVSELTNDAGYLTSFTESQILSIGHDTIFLTGGSFVKLPAGFSGDYNDLTNTPTIPTVPTNVSELTNDAGYLTSFTESQILTIGHDTIFLTGGSYVKLPAGFSGDYNDLTNTPTIPTVPTNVSELTNDAGYLTSYTETQTLANVAAHGNAVETQIKQLSDPTEGMDAVNLRTLNAVVADWSHRFDSLAHRFDSITHSLDSIIQYQDSVIDTLSQLVTELSSSLDNAFDENGASNAVFTVASGRTVKFSKGNLQYSTAGTHTVTGGGTETGTWRFADHQYDIIGNKNIFISSSYTGWIDLFGWGTSGWNSGANAYQPWATSTTSIDYYPGGSYANDLTGTYARADWGVYNAISNGGNQAGMWRTLTRDEWGYLLYTRSTSTVGGTANARYAKARVDETYGLIILPDTFTLPIGLVLTNINTSSAYFIDNTYTNSQWSQLEEAGCIFLPLAGIRNGTTIGSSSKGWYASSSYYNVDSVCCMFFYEGVFVRNGNRKDGISIRLVQDVDGASMATVTTSTVSNTTTNSATCGGDVTDDGGATVTARGVCWSTSHNPTVSNSHTTDGNGTGAFSSSITGLSASTTYYVRAYATNSEGTAYGNEQSFTTEDGAVSGFDENGASNAVFTVAAGRAVKFSRGNLQYTTTGTHTVSGGGTETGTWRFAEHQYDAIGSANTNISSSYTGWIDLFGWGTSGWNSGANAYQPWATSTSYSDYYPGGSYTNNLTGTYARADWGVYNAISNGGNQPGMWRTLTKDEWGYLITTRSASTVGGTANARYANAKVNGTSGVIIFPDTFTLPTELTMTNVNNSSGAYTSNTYTSSQWGQLEAAGCIFLPAAGFRQVTGVYDVGTLGYYWSSTYSSEYYLYRMYFLDDRIGVGSYSRHDGLSVRLVKDVE